MADRFGPSTRPMPMPVISTVKTRIKEPLLFGARLAKDLKLRSFKGHFTQTLGRGRGYVVKLWSEIASDSSTIW